MSCARICKYSTSSDMYMYIHLCIIKPRRSLCLHAGVKLWAKRMKLSFFCPIYMYMLSYKTNDSDLLCAQRVGLLTANLDYSKVFTRMVSTEVYVHYDCYIYVQKCHWSNYFGKNTEPKFSHYFKQNIRPSPEYHLHPSPVSGIQSSKHRLRDSTNKNNITRSCK